MERLLRSHGFTAVVFDSAGALLRYGRLEEACCLLLDINLNGESGITLRRKLASEGATVPVVYITGNDSQATETAAIESGCAAYLSKPFAASELIETVERACLNSA